MPVGTFGGMWLAWKEKQASNEQATSKQHKKIMVVIFNKSCIIRDNANYIYIYSDEEIIEHENLNYIITY